jgi:putative nucleotidyltransferase with HDIG domain
MNREEALQLLKGQMKSDVLIKHCLATEAIMKRVARELGEDEDRWGLCGLLHDLDFEQTSQKPEEHTLMTTEMLRKRNFDEDIIVAIQEHNAEAIGRKRETKMGIALTCSESITGLVVAATLVMPDKKIANLKPKSVRKRMKEKAFAKNVSRESIRECERIGLDLERFVDWSIEAMKDIAPDLGL